jgi:DNA-binding NtrC family response regulator
MSTSEENVGATVKRIPAFTAVKELVERVLPGAALPMARLRTTIYAFCANPLASCFHIAGEIGAGKSTAARVIAMAKRLAPLKAPAAARILKDLRFERPGLISQLLMPWYVELPLTGLAETAAESQLFGVAAKTFTNVAPRSGVFELASTARGVSSEAAAVTGGAVFLDEIAELPMQLQAKLLPVLSGGAYYRLGGEGDALTYKGITITASWKPLDERTIRPDLLSRISDYVGKVPHLEERLEDFDSLVHDIHAHLSRLLAERIDQITKGDSTADRDALSNLLEEVETLDATLIAALRAVPWRLHGNMRGLVRAMERIIIGKEDPAHVISELRPSMGDGTGSRKSVASNPDAMYRVRLARGPNGDGLAKHVKDLQKSESIALRTFLLSEPGRIEELAKALRLEPESLRVQVRQLGRDRTRREDGDD